ncbi:MAG: STAS/SEC14 domain-containing protein [Kordia sp.]|uniref:STAS/SEC14 domain-containing protein n=1 Tax=Kordia sp. TaxID=1965332 RepID=UPI003858B308
MNIIGKKLRDIYTFERGKLYLYDDLVIGEINEGVHISSETLLSFFEFFHENYKVPFGYISHRINSYSIDPQVYKMLPENNLLKGIAVVSDQKFSSLNAHVEKNFYNGHYELFTTINTAVNWLDTIALHEKNSINISGNSVA